MILGLVLLNPELYPSVISLLNTTEHYKCISILAAIPLKEIKKPYRMTSFKTAALKIDIYICRRSNILGGFVMLWYMKYIDSTGFRVKLKEAISGISTQLKEKNNIVNFNSLSRCFWQMLGHSK